MRRADPYSGWRWKLKMFWINVLNHADRLTRRKPNVEGYKIPESDYPRMAQPADPNAVLPSDLPPNVIELNQWKRTRRTPTPKASGTKGLPPSA